MSKPAKESARPKKISDGRNLNIRIPQDICDGLARMESDTCENPAPAIRASIRSMLVKGGYLEKEK